MKLYKLMHVEDLSQVYGINPKTSERTKQFDRAILATSDIIQSNSNSIDDLFRQIQIPPKFKDRDSFVYSITNLTDDIKNVKLYILENIKTD